MSEETKEAAKNTEYSLQKAERHLNDAERFAKQSGDKNLTQKVTKIREATQETRKDLDKKLNEG